MSKFKIGDRVRLLSDATQLAEVGGESAPNFGRKGEIGTVDNVDSDGDFHVVGVGEVGVGGWFCTEQLEHADDKPAPTPDTRSTKLVGAAHDAIDRLVTELERQATEHVHALDALRAENEALRTINAGLRDDLAIWAKRYDEADEFDKQRIREIAGLKEQNEHLRHLVEESRKVHEMNARLDGVLPTR